MNNAFNANEADLNQERIDLLESQNEVEVKDVLWEASKHGVIKPRVVFDKIFY